MSGGDYRVSSISALSCEDGENVLHPGLQRQRWTLTDGCQIHSIQFGFTDDFPFTFSVCSPNPLKILLTDARFLLGPLHPSLDDVV